MPLISTLGSAGAQSFGNKGFQVGGSAFFNGGGDALTTSPNNAFVYGTGNFTVEMWVYPLNFSDYRFLWQQTSNTRDTRFWIYTNINTGQLIYVNGVNASAITTNGLTLNEWNHIALVRNSFSSRFFLNGIGYGAVSDFRDYNFDSTGLCIGKFSSVSNLYPWSGNITNVRVAKQAIYTSNFTPSGPLSRTSQNSNTTEFLLNMRSPSALTTDSGPNSIVVTNVASVTYSTLTPFNLPYVIPPTVIVSSATVTPSTITPREGDTITVNVVGTNTPNGTYFYSLQEDLASGALTGNDFTSGSLTGSFTISGNSGSFPITVTADLLTEGNETFTIYVRQNSTSGTIIGTSAEITITDSSLTPAFTVTPGSVNEGSSASFTVQNVGPNGTYFFTILNGTSANADFSAVSGSFTVSGSTGGLDNGTGSFSVPVVADSTTEGSQTFQVQVRSGSTSGPVIITSNSVTINDTSQTPAVIVSSSYGEGGGFNFSTSGMPAGTYYWTINHITTSSEDFTADSGTFTRFNNNTQEIASPAVGTVADYTTEGAETFSISIRTGSTSGPVVVTSSTITLNDTTKTVTVTPSSSTMTEGETISIFVGFGDNLSTIPNGTTVAWSIVHGTTTPADFTGSTSGLIVNAFGSGTDPDGNPIQITAASDIIFETDETFQVDIRFQSGTLIKRSEVITITGIA